MDRVADRVLLKGTLVEMFTGLNVIDAGGEFVGIVRDMIETEDTWDSILVEDEEGEMVVVVLEDIKSIDEFVELVQQSVCILWSLMRQRQQAPLQVMLYLPGNGRRQRVPWGSAAEQVDHAHGCHGDI